MKYHVSKNLLGNSVSQVSFNILAIMHSDLFIALLIWCIMRYWDCSFLTRICSLVRRIIWYSNDSRNGSAIGVFFRNFFVWRLWQCWNQPVKETSKSQWLYRPLYSSWFHSNSLGSGSYLYWIGRLSYQDRLDLEGEIWLSFPQNQVPVVLMGVANEMYVYVTFVLSWKLSGPNTLISTTQRTFLLLVAADSALCIWSNRGKTRSRDFGFNWIISK